MRLEVEVGEGYRTLKTIENNAKMVILMNFCYKYVYQFN